jgi:acetyltransferase-like isoleucine patch superfamily enzyme
MRPALVLSILRKAVIVPINSGTNCFMGSSCVILSGSVLPDHCVLGAPSLQNKTHTQTWGLYACQPDQWRKPIAPDAAYFNRERGFVL